MTNEGQGVDYSWRKYDLQPKSMSLSTAIDNRHFAISHNGLLM